MFHGGYGLPDTIIVRPFPLLEIPRQVLQARYGVRDEAGGDRRGTRRGVRRKLSPSFFGTVALGQFSFFKNNINFLFWNKILHSKLSYKRGTKTNELF
jgi:hypothetical protein